MINSEGLKFIVSSAHSFLEEKIRRERKSNNVWRPFDDLSESDIVKMHLSPNINVDNATREEIFSRLLLSIQNRSGLPNIISGQLVNGWEDLGDMLGGFNPEAILEKWENHDELFSFFLEQKRSGRIGGEMRSEKKSAWPQFSRGIISSANFFAKYKTSKEFMDWQWNFKGDPYLLVALPLILSREIYGLGFALACDFLKEIGRVDFPKPDTHTKFLINNLGISSAQDDYQAVLDICWAARKIDLTPYEFDKILWLIGSGRFYLIRSEGKELSIGRNKKYFIDYIKSQEGAITFMNDLGKVVEIKGFHQSESPFDE
ncbi:hypothetical protein [Azospirillum sp.]|uniref:hypothetical protein n=1 Tax=Azospirillum sp. TaxID=34012 RepID=UPI002621B381|nr:hypothetical protein [Azospirillum sp.]